MPTNLPSEGIFWHVPTTGLFWIKKGGTLNVDFCRDVEPGEDREYTTSHTCTGALGVECRGSLGVLCDIEVGVNCGS